jgi:hypothetical protein
MQTVCPVAGASSNAVSTVPVSSNAVVVHASSTAAVAPVSSNAVVSVPATSKAPSPAATTATVAAGSTGLTKTTTGGQVQFTGAASLTSASRAVALFSVLLAIFLF